MRSKDGEGEAVNLSAHIQIIQIFRAVLCNMLLASGKVISQQQVKHPGRFLHVRGQRCV